MQDAKDRFQIFERLQRLEITLEDVQQRVYQTQEWILRLYDLLAEEVGDQRWTLTPEQRTNDITESFELRDECEVRR